MDNLHNRLKVELGRKNEIFTTVRKNVLKIGRIAKYGGEIL